MRRTMLALMLAVGMAQAQGVTPAPSSSQPPAAMQGSSPGATSEKAPRRARRPLAQRFEDANATHDGRLTAEQARAGMPAVARNFAAIDTGNRGYVTVEDIQAYNRSKRAARRAAKNAASQ